MYDSFFLSLTIVSEDDVFDVRISRFEELISGPHFGVVEGFWHESFGHHTATSRSLSVDHDTEDVSISFPVLSLFDQNFAVFASR